MNRPVQAPGCFGIGTICMVNKSWCSKCPALEPCKEEAEQSLKAASAFADVSQFSAKFGMVARRVKAAPLDPSEIKLLTALSGKPLQVATTLRKRGLDPKLFLEKRVNPFGENEKPQYMQAGFQSLLDSDCHTIHRSSIAEAIARKNADWSQSTVRSHTASFIRVMEHFGVLEDIGRENFTIRKKSCLSH